MNPKHIEKSYDAVIVGAGAAGLSAALGMLRSPAMAHMRAEGREPSILVISKLQPLRSHTGSAEGGIAASLGNERHDDWHWHYFDTVKGGDWLVDQDAARMLAEYAPETVINLERSGVAFSRMTDGHIAQRRFGGHTADFGREPIPRAAYAADRIGHQILFALWQQCVGQGVDFADEWYVTDLVLDRSGQRARGVVAFDIAHGEVHTIHASTVLMATGGAGRLFGTTSNSWDLTGDGMALALAAGLQVEDIEFIQFHPTGLAHTGLLLSEAARAEGGVLRNARGEAFMQRYAPDHGDLSARDVVSRAVTAEIAAGRGVPDPREPQAGPDCVWLDMTAIDPQRMRTALPQVLETIRTYAGLDPTRDMVPVKPTAHYTMGGIPITTEGEVYRWQGGERRIVDGLYAAGECSCVGVHGANRLGGNSLLDACLFGGRAGAAMAARIETATSPADDGVDPVYDAVERRRSQVAAWLQDHDASGDETMSAPSTSNASDEDNESNKSDESGESDAQDTDGTASDNPYRLFADLGAVMERALAVHCDAESVARALNAIERDLAPRAAALHPHDHAAAFNQELTAIWEARHLITLARTVLRCSDARHESRGSLHRDDYPDRDDRRYLAHTMGDASGAIGWQPVHILGMPPAGRTY